MADYFRECLETLDTLLIAVQGLEGVTDKTKATFAYAIHEASWRAALVGAQANSTHDPILVDGLRAQVNKFMAVAENLDPSRGYEGLFPNP